METWKIWIQGNERKNEEEDEDDWVVDFFSSPHASPPYLFVYQVIFIPCDMDHFIYHIPSLTSIY